MLCVIVKLLFLHSYLQSKQSPSHKVQNTEQKLISVLYFIFNYIFSVFIHINDTQNLRHLHLYRLTFFIWMQNHHVNSATQY